MLSTVRKTIWHPLSLTIILGGSVLLATFLGSFKLNLIDAFLGIFYSSNDQVNYLIWEIRLPRILLAGTVGAGLAISGAAIQGLFRNPLADPTLIGVSSGAMLMAVLSIVFLGVILPNLSVVGIQIVMTAASFVGGLVTTRLVYQLSSKRGRVNVATMLLAGIAISAFAAAVTGFIIYISNDQQLRDITFWSLGSFGGTQWFEVFVALPLVLVGTVAIFFEAKALNAMLLGEKEAIYLGIPVERTKTRIIFLTSMIVGVCISVSGLIGFVGLVIPHFIRLLKGPDHRFLLAGSALLGASFMILADTAARVVIEPAELPVGILTACVGAPFFLWLLLRSKWQV